MQHQKKKRKKERKINGRWNVTPEKRGEINEKKKKNKDERKGERERGGKISFHFNAIFFCLSHSSRTQNTSKDFFFFLHTSSQEKFLVNCP